MNFYIDHSCSYKSETQVLLNKLCGYQNNISLKIQHRGRLNLFYFLMKKLVQQGQIKNFDNALDIGCGSGIYSHLISNFGFKNVTGIDITSTGIDYANEHFGSQVNGAIVRFQVSNAETFENNEKYNFILCTEVIEHTSDPHKVVESIKSLLSPDGIAIITLPNRISWPYFIEYLAYKIKNKPFNQELMDHLNYPFYKSIALFKDEKIKVIKTSGSNSMLDSASMKIFYKTFFFEFINKINFLFPDVSHLNICRNSFI